MVVFDYTHYAVNKNTGLIVNGWDYKGIDPKELHQFRRDYFFDDLEGMEFDPKEYKILTYNTCKARGIDPKDMPNFWSNDGKVSIADERRMNQQDVEEYDDGDEFEELNEAKIRRMVRNILSEVSRHNKKRK
jgi:hypothetical protein